MQLGKNPFLLQLGSDLLTLLDRCHCDASQSVPALQHHTDQGLPQDTAGEEDGSEIRHLGQHIVPLCRILHQCSHPHLVRPFSGFSKCSFFEHLPMQAAKGREGPGGKTALPSLALSYAVAHLLTTAGCQQHPCVMHPMHQCYRCITGRLQPFSTARTAQFRLHTSAMHTGYCRLLWARWQPRSFLGLLCLPVDRTPPSLELCQVSQRWPLLQPLADECLKCKPSWKQVMKAALGC